jgi:hypothetical protein
MSGINAIRPTLVSKLEFEAGRLVKVDGRRPQYMSGAELIALVGVLGVRLDAADKAPISTRRALEVVLARVPVHRETRDSLVFALQAEIWRDAPSTAPVIDADAILARIRIAEAEGADVHDGLSKATLIMRLQATRKILRDLVGEIEATTREADHG